jgi:hypothetical protein
MAALTQSTVPPWVGAVKTFGRFGPAYEVLGPAGRSPEGKDLVMIRVLRTGETTEYEADAMTNDPGAM